MIQLSKNINVRLFGRLDFWVEYLHLWILGQIHNPALFRPFLKQKLSEHIFNLGAGQKSQSIPSSEKAFGSQMVKNNAC